MVIMVISPNTKTIVEFDTPFYETKKLKYSLEQLLQKNCKNIARLIDIGKMSCTLVIAGQKIKRDLKY